MNGLARSDRAAPLLAAVSAVVSHATALSSGYVWLDHAHIEEGLAIAPPGAWLSLFFREFAGTGFYRPLMALSLSLDAAISSSAAYFHAVTLAWHAAASALVVLAARSLGTTSRAALAAGLLFAVHPLTSQVASAIAFRSEAMSLAFLLSLVVLHLGRRILGAALGVLACALTKETAWLLAPLFIVALEFTAPRIPRSREHQRARVRLLSAEAAAWSFGSVLHWVVAPHLRASFAALTFDEQLGTRFAALAKGFLRAVVPTQRTICDAFPATSLKSPLALLGVALALWLLVTRAFSRRTQLLLLAALLPALQLAPVMRWWSPHYFYVPFAFAAIGMAELAERKLKRFGLVLAGTVAACAALSWIDAARYRDDASLWGPEVASDPACREGHFYLGEVARISHDLRRAAFHYERAARVTPGVLAYADERSAYANLGAVSLASGRLPEARAALSQALERATSAEQRRGIVYDLALVALASGEPAEAVRLLDPETRAPHPLPEGLLVRARALHELGREQEAQEMLARRAKP